MTSPRPPRPRRPRSSRPAHNSSVLRRWNQQQLDLAAQWHDPQQGGTARSRLDRVPSEVRWNVDHHFPHRHQYDDFSDTPAPCPCEDCASQAKVPTITLSESASVLWHGLCDLWWQLDEDAQAADRATSSLLGYHSAAAWYLTRLLALAPEHQEVARALMPSWQGTFQDLLGAAVIA